MVGGMYLGGVEVRFLVLLFAKIENILTALQKSFQHYAILEATITKPWIAQLSSSISHYKEESAKKARD